jgi:hypothetical protein
MGKTDNDTFITDTKGIDEFQLYDFLFPGGSLAKLCKYKMKGQCPQEVKLQEIQNKFNLSESCPVILLSGVSPCD